MLHFPDQETLHLVLASGTIPERIASTPVEASFPPGGAIRIRPSKTISKSLRESLAPFGVRSVRGSNRFEVQARCWAELLSLSRTVEAEQVERSTPVVFDLPTARMPEMVGEILRLGNDRQALRWYQPPPLEAESGSIDIVEGHEDGDEIPHDSTANGPADATTTARASRVLLRVIGPPYYALLRALDPELDPADGPIRAYVERAPRLLVQLGYQHPLTSMLHVPEGQVALLSAPRQWTLIQEDRFRDVYSVLDLSVPGDASTTWRATEPDQRLQVPLGLARSSSNEPAELWVLRGPRAIEQLDALVRDGDDQLINRFAFAVASEGQSHSSIGDLEAKATGVNGSASTDTSTDDATRIILRVRPSKQAPPALVLDGLACRPYLRLPNLFLPIGTRIHPPLRRDAVAKLLAAEPDLITWLVPEDEGDDPRRGPTQNGRTAVTRLSRPFRPERLADSAFQPLERWVDYIIERDAAPLTAWLGASSFAFDAYICPDDQDSDGPAPREPVRPRRTKGQETRDASATTDQAEPPSGPAEVEKTNADDGNTPTPFDATPQDRRDEQRQLDQLEAEFLASDTPADDPSRQTLWSRMAWLNARLGRSGDASICYAHSLWEEGGPADPGSDPVHSSESRGRLGAWRDFEAHTATFTLDESGLDELLPMIDPGSNTLRALAAELACAAASTKPPAWLIARRGRIQEFLSRHEARLPTRAGWFAWLGLSRLADDALMLAQARDRFLERLHGEGLSSERDLPGFLRFGAEASGERLRTVRDQMMTLRDRARTWVRSSLESMRTNRSTGTSSSKAAPIGPYTLDLAELSFAYGLTRLGDHDHAQAMAQEALTGLRKKRGSTNTEISIWLGEAYLYRIEQARTGHPLDGPLPDELMNRHKKLDKDKISIYKLDKLRNASQILEPHERIEPYRFYQGGPRDDISRELVQLEDLRDADEVRSRITKLLQTTTTGPRGVQQRAQVLKTALNLAFRMGERFLDQFQLLDEVEATVGQLRNDVVGQSALLERALHVAAHYDRREVVRVLTARFEALLADQPNLALLGQLEPVLSHCLRALRKLGMHDDVARLLEQVTTLVKHLDEQDETSSPTSRLPLSRTQYSPRTQRFKLMLHLAAVWFDFGQESRGQEILEATWNELLHGKLKPLELISLTCDYLGCLRHASVEEALRRIGQIFEQLPQINDTRTSIDYYVVAYLEILESIVLTLVSDEFTLDKAGRRWLDDDEYLVRRRIHHDVRAALAASD